MNLKNNFPLFDIQTGYGLGNMYQGLYSPYNNFTNYMIEAKCPRNEALLDFLAYKFACDEFRLFLDVYPNHKQIQDLYIKTLEEYHHKKNYYENKFGILDPYNCKNINDYIQGPWPWENRKGD